MSFFLYKKEHYLINSVPLKVAIFILNLLHPLTYILADSYHYQYYFDSYVAFVFLNLFLFDSLLPFFCHFFYTSLTIVL